MEANITSLQYHFLSIYAALSNTINPNAMSAGHITFRKSITQTFGKIINFKFIQVIIGERVRSGRKKNMHTNKYPTLSQAVPLGLL